MPLEGAPRLPAASLPVDPGPAAWAQILPRPRRYRPLQGAREFDWLVIGAGFAGLSAARRLRQLRPGASIAVIEAARIAEGASGRNSGFMIDLPHHLAAESYAGALAQDRATIAQNRAAIAFAQEAARAYAMPPEALAPVGKVNAAATEAGERANAAYARHLERLGEPFAMLDGAAMRETCGTGFYRSGLFTPGTVMLQPALYIRCLAEGLAAEGVEIFEDTPALELAPGWRVRTPDGEIRAGRVILAVNGHVESFGLFRRRLMHVFTFASMTRPLEPREAEALGGAPDWGVTPAHPMGTTVRRISTPEGARIVVRNRFLHAPSMRVSPMRLRGVWRDHARAFASRFPQLGAVEMEYRWGGRLCLTRNDAWAFGEVAPGLFSACAQNGLGTVRGTLAGLRAAELACGADSEALDAFLALPGPRRLPPWPLPELGAPLYLRWMERRAGREL